MGDTAVEADERFLGPAAGAAITAPPLLSWRPAYGKPSKPRYGKMLGQKSFRIVAKKR